MAIKSAWDGIIRQEAKAVKVEMKSSASQSTVEVTMKSAVNWFREHGYVK